MNTWISPLFFYTSNIILIRVVPFIEIRHFWFNDDCRLGQLVHRFIQFLLISLFFIHALILNLRLLLWHIIAEIIFKCLLLLCFGITNTSLYLTLLYLLLIYYWFLFYFRWISFMQIVLFYHILQSCYLLFIIQISILFR